MDSKFRALKDSNDLSILKGLAFEEYLLQLFSDLGYSATKTPASGDYGADLLLTDGDKTIVVQAKRYANAIGFDAIKEVSFAQRFYDADEAWVVATNGFTAQARVAASKTDIKLVDSKGLDTLIARSRKTPGQLEAEEAQRALRKAEEQRRARAKQLEEERRERERIAREDTAWKIHRACLDISSTLGCGGAGPLWRLTKLVDWLIDLGDGFKKTGLGPGSSREDYIDYFTEVQSLKYIDRDLELSPELIGSLIRLVTFVPICQENATIKENNETIGFAMRVPKRPQLSPEFAESWEKISTKLLAMRASLEELSHAVAEAHDFKEAEPGDVMDEGYWTKVINLKTNVAEVNELWACRLEDLREIISLATHLCERRDSLLTDRRNHAEGGGPKLTRDDDGNEACVNLTWRMRAGTWQCLREDVTPLAESWVYIKSQNVWCRTNERGEASKLRYEGDKYRIDLPIDWENNVVARTQPNDIVNAKRPRRSHNGYILKYASKEDYTYRRLDRSHVAFLFDGKETFGLNVYITDDVELPYKIAAISHHLKLIGPEKVPNTTLMLNANFDAGRKDADATYHWVSLKE